MQSIEAMAFEATAALDRYEEQLAFLVEGDRADSVPRAQAELRRLSDLCLRLPQLASSSLALLLAHHRLLAEMARDEGPPPRALACMDAVEECIRVLRRQCRELFVAAHLH